MHSFEELDPILGTQFAFVVVGERKEQRSERERERDKEQFE
jgi:hypothetical protein